MIIINICVIAKEEIRPIMNIEEIDKLKLIKSIHVMTHIPILPYDFAGYYDKEKGNHSQLMAEEGIYKRFWKQREAASDGSLDWKERDRIWRRCLRNLIVCFRDIRSAVSFR